MAKFLTWPWGFFLKLLNTSDVYRNLVMRWGGDKHLSSSFSRDLIVRNSVKLKASVKANLQGLLQSAVLTLCHVNAEP